MMRTVAHAAYRASIDLPRQRGPFPALDTGCFLLSPFVAALPGSTCNCSSAATGFPTATPARGGARRYHQRLAGNVSSGIEPIFGCVTGVPHRLDRPDETLELTDYAVTMFRRI